MTGQTRRLGKWETGFVLWALLALGVLLPVTILLDATFPILTVVWIIVPLLIVLRQKDARRVGFRPVGWRALLTTTAINLGVLWGLMALFEPWTHIYRMLIHETLANPHPDTTFAWLVRFEGVPAWSGLFLYSGLITLFGEELFFRGWLQQRLERRLARPWAIALQAALFSIPQLLVTLLFPPLQSVLWVVVYSWLAIGVVGGWSASQTRSIWPSLIAATLTNFLLTWLSVR